MRFIEKQNDIDAIEPERALVGVFVDRNYNQEKIEWLFSAREGFDKHALDAWHLLIPVRHGYGVNTMVQPHEYGTALAAAIIDRLGIEFPDLPCIVFRASENEYFYLKLGGRGREKFAEEIGRVADIARRCQKEGPEDPQEFRQYVNMHVALHLKRRRLLSATRSALPAICALLGVAVDVTDLV